MTDKERAEEIVFWNAPDKTDIVGLTRAIELALAEVRDECVKAAENHKDECFACSCSSGMCCQIAEKIRALGKKRQ